MSDVIQDDEDSVDFSKKINKEIWKEVFNFVKPYKAYIFMLIFCNFVQMFSINFFPLLTRHIIDNYAIERSTAHIVKFGIIFFCLVCVTAISTFFQFVFTGKLEVSVKYKMRQAAFDKLQVLDLSYYDKTKVGWILARVCQDTQTFMEIFSWTLLDFTYGFFAFAFFIIAMCILNVKLALIAFIGLPIIIVLSFIFHSISIKIQRGIKKANSKITAAYNEDIQGAKTTKIFVREEKNTFDFKILAKSLRQKRVHSSFITAIFIPVISLIGCLGAVLVLHTGGNDVLIGSLSVGTFYAMFYYAVEIYEPTRQIAAIFSDVLYAQAGAERIFSLINQVPHIVDRTPSSTENYPPMIGNVEFKHVSFSYSGSSVPVLKDFSLNVKAGQTIAFVGETGSGKSTIVNLLSRFYEPTDGSIYIDGQDYRDLPQSWLHASLGIVLQTPHLFSGTVAENVRYGKYDASDDEIMEACKMAQAHDFIEELESGYNTDLGEGANKISTGQKQLISIARAIIRDPKILILDEATSSVDTETEYKIQESLTHILKNRTSFIVAHRLSTIRNADLILVIQDGIVIEQGTHKELMEKRGHYYNLYVKQFIEREENNVGL